MGDSSDAPRRHSTTSQASRVDGANADMLKKCSSITRQTPLVDLSSLPTIFPTPIANLVTAVATSTRLSLRMAAFLIEAMLETSQYSTRMSLGYTRRLLITAISSARRVYLMTNAARDGDLLGLLTGGGTGGNSSEAGGDYKPTPTTDAFLQVLDKYTNLGIYVIHHTFTMAELFAMSGFFLTTNAVQSVHYAAQESVALFDSLFGSNESSRALSAIITMVRKEVLEDERCRDRGKIASLAGLTKAMTAFACLQAATWKRTSERMKMRVLYDCTVLAEQEESYATSTSTSVLPQDQSAVTGGSQQHFIHPQAEDRAVAGPGPSTMRSWQGRGSHSSQLEEVNMRLWGDVQSSSSTSTPHSSQPQTRKNSAETWDVEDLEDLVGESGDEMYEGPPDDASREQHRIKRRRESTLEITDELTESTIVTQMVERVHADGRRYASSVSACQSSFPDVAVAVMDTDDEEPEVDVQTFDMSSPRRGSYLSASAADDENDWIEVDQLLDDDRQDETGTIIPSAPNGSSVAISSYRDALDHPQQNAERIQLVLRTMTNKLLQRKRTVRHVMRDDLSDTSSSDETIIPHKPSTERVGGTRPDVRDIKWRPPMSSVDSHQTPSSFISSLEGKSRSLSPRRPGATSSTLKTSGKEIPVDNAVSKAKAAFRPFTRSRKGSRAASPSSSDRSPPLVGTTLPHSSNQSIRKHPEGVRAPPPSPHSSMVLRSPAPTSSSARNDSDGSRRGTINRHDPIHTSRPTHRSGPSLATVREATHSSSSRIQAASASLMAERGEASSNNLFPHDSLVRNIHRFMRYSSAAYGQNFLRILGLGSSEFMFPSTGKHHANSWAFAQHTNIPIDCLLLSSFTESSASLIQQEAPPLVHYVAVEHDLKAVVLTCRGTLGLSDVLVDLTCEYQSIEVDGGDPEGSYYVHGGMWQSARKLTVKQSTVHQTLVDALTQYPTYGLILSGHSLGGGVAALLSILCSMPSNAFLEQNLSKPRPFTHPRLSTPFVTNFTSGLPPGRPIHCYAYGPPAVASPDLARYAQGLITSIVQDVDVVPTLSLGGMKDFKNVALTLSEEGNVAEEIVGRVIGIYRRKFEFQKEATDSNPTSVHVNGGGGGMNMNMPTDEEVLSDWMVSLIKTMRADMDNEKLLPPGMVYIMEHFDVFVTDGDELQGTGGKQPREKKVVHRQAHRVILRQCDSVEERFREPVFSKTMLQNHLPSQYERSTQLLYEGCGQGKL
ncbi:hypothetical protein IAR55_003583 [Kwoniella newhampshirensis]|uniref:sn-1-specific diacylglycerol lipase n=1 Tax=Kwoniella newhampshirensis TaxID=1651941 RepID=A0AAW0YS15_9TREE